MNNQLTAALTITVCLVTFLVCSIIGAFHYVALRAQHRQRRHILLLTLGFAAATLGYVEPVVRVLNPPLAVYLYVPYLLLVMECVVLLYHFLYLITDDGSHKPFAAFGYLMPPAIACALYLFSGQIPYGRRCSIMSAENLLHTPMSVDEILYMMLPFLFSIYNVAYWLGSLRRIRRYKQVADNYSADEKRTSLVWLRYFFWLLGISSLAPLARMAYFWNLSETMFILLFLLPPFEAILLYNAIKGNYVLVPPLTPSERESLEATAPERLRPISRRRFEHYMETKKPYLNPELCIADMLRELGTNRTYLSSFINQEYNMNFKTLINCYRLREVERLRQHPPRQGYGTMDLVLAAGFGSYSSYLNASRRQYESQMLPEHER
ncbi:MAG: hypothetical protein LBM06_07090 [Prevotellaceae bacterium]|jgi:AraC-like DNA-binding protein|nr:hypothetical protein [Prevotellaceae bacterium]